MSDTKVNEIITAIENKTVVSIDLPQSEKDGFMALIELLRASLRDKA